jgi:hypothetical protein
MSPFIKDGDVITVAPLRPPRGNPNALTGSPRRAGEANACGIGQVVAFVSPGSNRLVVHRIIGRHESRSIIQGDSLSGFVADAVHPDDILGRVVRVERSKKRVRLGLGPERYAIAILSRAGLLLPVVVRAAVLTRFLRNRPNESN